VRAGPGPCAAPARQTERALANPHARSKPILKLAPFCRGLNNLIGTPEMVALGKRYETPPTDKKTGPRR